MGRNFWHRIATTAVASALPGYCLLDVAALAAPRQPATDQAPAPVATGSMQLQVRRLGNSVELVVEGAGPRPQLQQSSRGSSWQGQLTTASPTGLRAGPQRISLPELGIQSVSLDGSGSSYSLSVTPMPGVPLARPVVSADGLNLILAFPTSSQASLQTNRLNLSQPGAVPLPTYAPPLQARAVAPPLGDMAVGSIYMRDPGALAISGPRITLNFKNVSASEALATLARIGGYGFVYVPEYAFATKEDADEFKSINEFNVATERGDKNSDKISGQFKISQNLRPITAFFVGESFANAFNSLLTAAGLQARVKGRTVFAGPNLLLSPFYGNQVSKIYRLNQASAISASQYLASLGALISQPETTNINTSSGSSTNTGGGSAGTTASATTSSSSETTEIKQFGGKSGPLLGLKGTIDQRLSTITLVGDPKLVSIAESYLKQIDLRQRQVALSVKILDVSLNNNSDIANSFAFKNGNTFILNDNGALSATFGSSTITATGGVNPGLLYPDQSFIDTLRAVVQSSSTKVLASPTLILSENPEKIEGGAAVAVTAGANAPSSSIGRPFANESFVTVGEQIVTSFTVTTSTNAPPVCSPIFSNAGLTFGARVNKIDDNGYITFSLSPEISAAVGVPQQISSCGAIRTINRRRLDTGSVRVRDGQTLILTGVINDDVTATVTKWPILGDIPLIGQFFRASGNNRRKNELIILVTPRVINDGDNAVYGYGFQPSTSDARQFIGTPASLP